MNGLISYDVFDTVATRAFAHPRDVFVRLGEELRRRGKASDAFAFARERWESERAARRTAPHEEAILAEIYRTLAGRLGWSGAEAGEALELELEIEARNFRAVPRLLAELAAARAEAGRLVFLSDMYLPSATLRSWLEARGVAQPGDALFVSGEMRANKSSGRLFAAAREALGGNFANWRHAGDHPFADVEKPRQLGIAATHRAQAHLTAREKAARGTTGEFAEPWRSLLAGAMRLARLERAAPTEREAVLWETGCTVAGPLFFGFVTWVLAEAERRGLERLYFVARDGQIFWRVARAIQAARPGRVECRYLYGSRLAFVGPAELESPEVLRELAAPTGQFHSLRQALAHLGVGEDWARPQWPARFNALDPDANLSVAAREELADWLLAPEQGGAVREAVARRSARARAYLEAEGLRAGASFALVDAGWRGTLQRNLERILGGGAAPRPLTGFYLGVLRSSDWPVAGEMHGYADRFGGLPLLRDESHKVLLELMAQSDHGQVAGFAEESAGRWAPVLRDPGPVDQAEIRLFQDAVLAFARRRLETLDEAKAPPEEFGRVAMELYRAFHDRPTRAEVRVFGFMPHADQVCEQNHATLCARLAWPAVAAALWNYRKRPPHWWIDGQAALGHRWTLRLFSVLKAWRWRLAGRSP